MSVSKTISLAAKLLKVDEVQLKKYATDLDDMGLLDATYYSIPIKGGDSLIVSDNGEVLYANSSVSFEQHIAAYQTGMRTPLADSSRVDREARAAIGEDYDDKGKPTGGWSGMIEYEPSDEDAGSYSIVGHGDTAEAAIADMEGTLARAIMLNTDGKYVTNETRGTARSDSGLAFF